MVQGKFAAQYLFKDAKKKKVYVVDDKQTYGAGLAAIFSDEFKQARRQDRRHRPRHRRGDRLLRPRRQGQGLRRRLRLLRRPVPRGRPARRPDQEDRRQDPRSWAATASHDPAFISASGEANEGDLATSIGYPVEKLPTAKKFIADYKAAGYKDPYAAYGGYSYDAGWAIIQAVKAVVAANDGKLPDDARAKVVEAMGKVSFDGVTGKVAFDEYGDTTNKQLTVYKVDGGTGTPSRATPSTS